MLVYFRDAVQRGCFRGCIYAGRYKFPCNIHFNNVIKYRYYTMWAALGELSK